MERPKHPLRMFGATALLGAGIFFGLKPQDHIMSADDYFQREHVLSSYPFTYEAVRYLDQIPFFNREVTTNGGGMTHNDLWGQWIEVFDKDRDGFVSDEAGLHELSHIYYNYLHQEDPNFDNNFMDAAIEVADHDIPYGYYWTLEHGYPGTKWKGIDHSDVTEWYASISSFSMGGTRNPIPAPLIPFYSHEFNLGNQTQTYQDVRYKNFEPNIDWSKPIDKIK